MVKALFNFLVIASLAFFLLPSCSEETEAAPAPNVEIKIDEPVKKEPPPVTQPPQKKKMLVKNKKGWKVIKADSYHPEDKPYKAIDGNPKSMWHTQWKGKQPKHPHEIQVDLGKEYEMHGFSYLTRQSGPLNGTIKEYEFYISNDKKKWGEPVEAGVFEDIQYDRALQVIYFDKAIKGRFIRLVSKSEVQGLPFACCAELNIVIEK